MKARLVGVVCAGLAVALMASVSNAALMTIVVEVNPASPGYIDATHAAGGNGTVILLDVYAAFGGQDADMTNDGVMGTVYGALRSSAGGLLGNLSFTPAAVVSAAGFSAGSAADLDVDTDLDIGATNGNSDVGWIKLFSGANVLAPAGEGDRLLVGTATFTVTDAMAAGTDVGWVYRYKSTFPQTNQAFKVDGTNYTLAGNDARLAATTANITPEPATMVVLALGGLGVLLRRKRA